MKVVVDELVSEELTATIWQPYDKGIGKGKGKGRYSSSWEPHLRATWRSVVVKDLRLKDKDKDKDLMCKDEDKGKESSFKDKDKDEDLMSKDEDKNEDLSFKDKDKDLAGINTHISCRHRARSHVISCILSLSCHR